jgi:hypothetical protein
MTLPNLTHITTNTCYLNFARFEIFINNIYSIFTDLLFTTQIEDITYLIAARWEWVILQNLCRIEELEFQYIEYFN